MSYLIEKCHVSWLYQPPFFIFLNLGSSEYLKSFYTMRRGINEQLVYTRSLGPLLPLFWCFLLHCVPQKCGGQTAVRGECFFAASSPKCSAASYHPDKSLPFPQMYRDLPHLLCVPVLPSTWRDFSHFSPSLIHLVSWKNPTLPLGLTSYVGVPCAYPLDSSGQSQLLFSYRTLTAISC